MIRDPSLAEFEDELARIHFEAIFCLLPWTLKPRILLQL